MRQKCTTILKVSVALILALMMVVGSISTVVAATITIEQSDSASDSTVTDVADAPDATGNDAADEPVPSGALVDKLADRVSEDIADADTQATVSTPLTDKLVRRVKDDIAGTGANVDLADTGAADVYAVAGSWDNWTKHYFNGSTGSATVSINLAANTSYKFKIYSSYGKTWYGANHTFTGTQNDYYFMTSQGDATLTTTYANTYTFTLKREDNGDGSVDVGITYPTSGSGGGGNSHTDLKIYGNLNETSWSTNGQSMTYMGTSGGYEYFTYVLDANKAQYVKFRDSNYYYSAPGDSDLTMSDTRTSPTKNNNGEYSWRHDGDAKGAYQINSSAGTKVVWAMYKGASGNEEVRTWCSKGPFFLTGYINGVDTPANNGSIAGLTGFASEVANSEEVTYTLHSTTAVQYVTITDSRGSCYNVFHPETHKSGSGTQADPHEMDRKPKGDNKWMVTGALSKKIVFTWNSTTSTLSWTFGTNSAIIYAKDGCAPINWDDKNNAGATSLSGSSSKYYYNFARIADTTVTSANGTTFSDVDCDIAKGTSGSTYEWSNAVTGGDTLTITTTITDETDGSGTPWRSKYYVVGWCINGVTYSGNNSKSVNTTKDMTNGVYRMTYTVPEDITAGEIIEITPIYYFIDSSNTITFYLEGYSSVSGEWGDTPFVYPFYGSLTGYQNSFGTYPGQPFVYVDGKYSTQIPITSSAISSNTYDGTIIKGITVSNGYADHVHRNLHYTTWQTMGQGGKGDDQFHMQTYDYDDFYKIYNEKRDSHGNRPNSIILRMKNETTRNNRDTYGGDSSGHCWAYTTHSNNPYPVDQLTNTNVADIATSGNGWELLTDRYGRPVDLFGNVIGTSYSATTEANKTAIRVISSGYNENIAGDYGTSWIIYTPDSNTCTESSGVYTCSNYTLLKDTTNDRYAIPPSIFLLNSASSFNTTTYPDASHTVDNYPYTDSVNKYKTMYTTLKKSGSSGTDALGRYVYVTYEKNAQRLGNNYSQGNNATTAAYGAKRLDARWYYTYATDMVSANIKVQCWNSTNSSYEDVSFVTDGSGYNGKNNITTGTLSDNTSVAGLKAYFTNTDFDGEVSSGDVLINSGDFAFKAETATGWKFDGWYIEYDGGASYSQISSSATASTPMSASDTLVARFEPITSGYLNISHTIGTDASNNGAGTASLRVKVYSDDTKASMLYDSGSTESDVLLDGNYISNNLGSYYIDVTLTTTPSGDDLVHSLTYDRFNTDKHISATNTGTLNTNAVYTSNFGFKVSDLYTNTAQVYLSLSYVSYLTAVQHDYVITYNYASRGSAENDKSFTAKGTFTSNEYSNYVTINGSNRTVTNAFIKSKAPFESNFKKTMTLDYAGASQSFVDVSNVITHTITISFTTGSDTEQYAIFELPYAYTTTGDSTATPATKKYTAVAETSGDNAGKVLKSDDSATFEITTNYLQYFTSTGSQEKVSKDIATDNHVNNDFITAPKTIYDAKNNKTLYFNYWQIYKTDKVTEVAKVYYVDFHYLAYDNYYITPVYNDIDSTVGSDAFVDPYKDSLGAAITYLGNSRNQWNTNDSTAHTDSDSQTYAADLIYNDFAISFSYKNQELKSSDDVLKIGVIIERIANSDSGADKSISDMSYYKTLYADTEATNKDKVYNYVNNGTDMELSAFEQVLTKGDLNIKNRMEKYFSFYSQYGQTAELAFDTDSNVDNFVYRAYSYIKLTDGSVAVSDPAYFCMKYTANLSYNGE